MTDQEQGRKRMNMYRTLRNVTVSVAMATLTATAALAQQYPTRPIEVICGYIPGSGADTIVRFITSRLEKVAGTPIVVHNRPGAFGNIATGALVAAKPDGYTILITGTSSIIGNLFVLKDAAYDPHNDIQPIATLLRNGFVLTTGSKSKVSNVSELTAILKTKGKDARYGQSSVNSLAASELYMSMTGTTAERINYKSSTDMIPDLVSGDLDFGMIDAVFALSQARQGRIKLLGGTPAGTRIPGAPDLPTMEQAGVAGYDFAANWGAWFPKNTPEAITKQMHAWLTQIMEAPDTKEFLEKNGAEALTSPFGGAAELVKADHEKWKRVAAVAKLEKQ
jgi:tripartite-type tricarboxylate transporter receptor subunit TctC